MVDQTSTDPPTTNLPPPQASDTTVIKNSDEMQSSNHEVKDILEARLIDAEYKVWKKNTPYLYDFVMTHSLEWPSLTCQWLPTTKDISGPATCGTPSTTDSMAAVEHSMLIGTHTTGEQNFLMVASVNLPKDDAVIDNKMDVDDKEDSSEKKPSESTVTISSSNYDEEKNEIGGFGNASSASSNAIGKIEIRMKLKHDGEVNRARHMPQNHFVVASRGPNPEIYIWDLSKHASFPDEGTVPSPQGVCIGHEKEGYGLGWNPHKEGLLATGSEDKTIRLWDVNQVISAKGTGSGTQIAENRVFRGHTDVVEDCAWSHRNEWILGSVGDDRSIRIWDIRKEDAIHCVTDAHKADINSISFNPVNEFLFATGSADKTVALWDLRNLKSPLEIFSGHTDQVYNVEWAPFNESILASCSADRRVGIWDLSRIGMEQTPEDAEDGPPELLFLHGGHTSKVSDFSWNVNNEWSIASVSEDNVLQVWNMAEEIYAEDEEIVSIGEEDASLKDDDLE